MQNQDDSGAADTTWLSAEDVDLLMNIADLATDFVVNWGLLTAADPARAGGLRQCLDDVADDLVPLLNIFEERFNGASDTDKKLQ